MLKIGITIGDPAGIGPELILKISKSFDPQRAYIIYGEKKIMGEISRELSISLPMEEVYTVEEVKYPGVYIADLDICDVERPLPSLTSGKVAVAYLGRAVVDAVYGKVQGLLTMPINKFWAKLAGFSYEGQTEFIARACNVRDYAMLMYSERIRVIPLTTHIPLREVPEKVKKEHILSKAKLAVREYERLFGYEPTLGVLGLNPHAGDGGAIGDEDIKEIMPAVEELKSEGYKVDGPLSPDSAFISTSFDLYMSMYHDQGLIPFKMLSFRDGVNLTLGIPFVRTSPDHGVAYDIAWKGIADETSALKALELCEKLSERAYKP
ncbi:MAG: 4-hydroxythreonine-4-phosphate dehydrogenase PdxA [Acidobacteria bacterium]|jgi:4-hydroxythreonine-4-phosphate dehydrogenase|nr:MAG: 4-hydroxythreonine-4-phosphate dehydrogenase PdxA [Acidobacteriota bacterium]